MADGPQGLRQRSRQRSLRAGKSISYLAKGARRVQMERNTEVLVMRNAKPGFTITRVIGRNTRRAVCTETRTHGSVGADGTGRMSSLASRRPDSAPTGGGQDGSRRHGRAGCRMW